MARVRTFIGVEIGDVIRTRAVALQSELARTCDDVKWVEPRNLHVTLVFLGEVADRELPAVCRAVAEVAAGEPPIPLRVSGLGAFPNTRRPRTLWTGVGGGADGLIRLHGALEDRFLNLGIYRREERPFTPHLTLGRIQDEAAGTKLAAALPRHRDWDGGQTLVEEIVVFASDLGRDGPRYTPLGRGELGGQADRRSD